MKDTILKEGGLRSFLRGFMSAFDLSGSSFIDISDFSNGFERDRKALEGDWIRVGSDMRRAMNSVIHEQ